MKISLQRRQQRRTAATMHPIVVRSSTFASKISFLLLLFCCLLQEFSRTNAAISCKSNEECQQKLQRPESFCKKDGFCSNPFVKGCLATLMKNHSDSNGSEGDIPTRICNTDDVTDEHCLRYADFDYPEIRIHNGNWESSIFYAWVLQIVLMEILKVPATVGLTTNTTAISSFYSLDNTLEYSAEAYPFDALENAVDCHLQDGPCTQVLPEVWNGQAHELKKASQKGFIEPVEGNGAVGKGSWYIPQFAAQEDSSLVSVYGLQGEEHRHKLASAFRRPTTWLEYCQEVSPTRCDEDDPVAAFYPSTPEQEQHYFHPQFFPGYFRLLPENDCTENPTTCTGYIVGPSCTWSTNVDAQLYWNDVILKPDGPVQPNGGYEYKSMVEIWRAANATGSPVVMWWWKPEALVEEFFGSPGSFQQILLPEATEVCSQNRVDTEARCSNDIWERRGKQEGACDQEFHALLRVVALTFQQQAQAEPLDTKSPGYDLVKNLKLTDLELNEMLRRWVDKRVDPYGNDAREAVCSWVVENYDDLLEFLPPGYPKQIDSVDSYEEGYMIAALVCGILTSLIVIAIAAASYHYRHRRVIVYAQVHVVLVILVGFLLISIGAILLAVEPTPAICIAQVWFVNLGYAVHLIPLLVKIAAINKIMSSAKKMKRVKINKVQMFKVMGGLLSLVILYLIIWSAVDPVKVVELRKVTNATSAVVEECITCSSRNSFWYYIALGFQGLLLVMASVLAFQSRDTIPEFDESRSLGTMIYSHSLFMGLRCIVVLFDQREILEPGVSAAVMSYLLSFDTITAMGIYLVPKILQARSSQDHVYQRRTGLGGVQTSAAVDNIEAIAAQSFLNSEASAPPRIAVRQGRGSLTTSQAGDTSHIFSSASQLCSGTTSSSQRRSGSSSQLFNTALQMAQPQQLSGIEETSKDLVESAPLSEDTRPASPSKEQSGVLSADGSNCQEEKQGGTETMDQFDDHSSSADSDYDDVGGPRFRTSRLPTGPNEPPTSLGTSSTSSPEVTGDEEGKTK